MSKSLTDYKNQEKREYYIKKLAKALTLKEVIKIGFRLEATAIHSAYLFEEGYELINNKKKELRQEALLSKKEEVFKKFRENLLNQEKFVIAKTAEDCNLEWWEIKELITLGEDDENTRLIKDVFLKEYGNKDARKLKFDKERIEEARLKIELYLESGEANFSKFAAKYKCTIMELQEAVTILEKNQDPLYFDLIEYNQKKMEKVNDRIKETREKTALEALTIVSKASNEELLGLLSIRGKQKSSQYIKMYCLLYNLDENLLIGYIKSGRPLEEVLTADSDVKNKLLLDFQKEIKERISDQILILTTDLLKEGENIFDYKAFYRCGRDLHELQRIAHFANLREEIDIIQKFTAKRREDFKIFDHKSASSLERMGILTIKDKVVKFTKDDFKESIKEINENKYPYVKGLLFQLIEEKVDKRNNQKMYMKKKG